MTNTHHLGPFTYTVIDADTVRIAKPHSPEGYVAPFEVATYKAREHYRRVQAQLTGTYNAETVCG